MLISYRKRSGDVSVKVPILVQEGETFQEGTARYQIDNFVEDAGRIKVRCRLIEGQHPFWWATLAEGNEITFDSDFLARTLEEKRAFGFSSQSL